MKGERGKTKVASPKVATRRVLRERFSPEKPQRHGNFVGIFDGSENSPFKMEKMEKMEIL